MKPQTASSLFTQETRKEQGAALILVLLLVASLTVLGGIFLTTSQTENQVSGNEVEIATALHLAEAAVELGKQRLKTNIDWNAVLADTQPFNCPNLGLTGGTCSYRIENDADGGGPTTDTNRIVVIKATGNIRNGNREIHVAYTRPIFPGAPGAVSFTGADARLDYSGAANSVDGNNWVPPSEDRTVPGVLNNSACGTGSGPQYGISVPTDALKDQLKSNINPTNWPGIMGSPPSSPWTPPSPTPSIGAVPGYLSHCDVVAMGDALLANADRLFTPGDDIVDEVLGTQTNPMIHAVDCTGYAGLCLKLNGSTQGTGFLIVKNGQALLRATASWIGVIIVYGTNVKFDTGGGGGPGNIIYGTIMISESTVAVPKQFRPRNTRTRYSCDAIAMANQALSANAKDVVWWKEVY